MLRAPSIIGSRQATQTASVAVDPAATTSRSSDEAARVSTWPFWIWIWTCWAPTTEPSSPSAIAIVSVRVIRVSSVGRLNRARLLLHDLHQVVRGRFRPRRHVDQLPDDL